MSTTKTAGASGRSKSAEEKLRLVVAGAGLEGQALGELLRREGLHEAELGQWRQAAVSGLEQLAGKPSAQARELAAVKKELARKERALAEAAALLMLEKKVHGIWGDADENTPPPSAK